MLRKRSASTGPGASGELELGLHRDVDVLPLADHLGELVALHDHSGDVDEALELAREGDADLLCELLRSTRRVPLDPEGGVG
eukprot:7167782-Alexandrium_andersonii.AAC.1